MKYAILSILALSVLAIWSMAFDPADLHYLHFMFGDEELDGPLAALVGLAAGGLGMLIALVVMFFVGVVLALVFAGLGVMAFFGLALGGMLLAVAFSPLVLPLVICLGIVWLFTRRRRASAAELPYRTPAA